MYKNNKLYYKIHNTNSNYFYSLLTAKLIANRRNKLFSTSTRNSSPTRDDQSTFSDNTTEKNLVENKNNRETKVTDFKDRYGDDELMDKRSTYNSLSQDEALKHKEQLEEDVKKDLLSLVRELQEGSAEVISEVNTSNNLSIVEKQLISENEREDLANQILEANKYADNQLWSIEDGHRLSKHEEGVDSDEMSSIASFSSTESTDNDPKDANNGGDSINPDNNSEGNNDSTKNKDANNPNSSTISSISDLSPVNYIVDLESTKSIFSPDNWDPFDFSD